MNHVPGKPSLNNFLALTGFAGLLCLSVFSFSSAFAATPNQQPTPIPTIPAIPQEDLPVQLSISDEICLSCHGKPGINMTLENGELLDLYVNPEDHTNSIHGEQGYACVQCHRQVGDYPHPTFTAQDRRDATLKLNNACKYCHAHQSELNQDGVHAAALNTGTREAAVCVDCHSSHAVQPVFDPKTNEILPEARQWIPQTCAKCHSLIYEKYQESVHGAALTGAGNPDVPTCIDCHGVHNIADPRTTEFRLKSPDICAKCHTDPAIMNKYGISTDVLNTYVADFHGTTQVLFEQQTPEQQFNKPVCYDCHGVHDIAHTDDPEKGLMVRSNLLERCQVCHPDASVNFPDAWLSHYIPSPNKYPLVYYVNLFYRIFIPAVIGGMAILVVLDFSRKIRDRYDIQGVIPSLLTRLKLNEQDTSNPGNFLESDSNVTDQHGPVDSDTEIPDHESAEN